MPRAFMRGSARPGKLSRRQGPVVPRTADHFATVLLPNSAAQAGTSRNGLGRASEIL
jgi:hypothetical protein